MAKLLKQSGHLKLTHAELFANGSLIEERFTVSHPTIPAEQFLFRLEAEARFEVLAEAFGDQSDGK